MVQQIPTRRVPTKARLPASNEVPVAKLSEMSSSGLRFAADLILWLWLNPIYRGEIWLMIKPKPAKLTVTVSTRARLRIK